MKRPKPTFPAPSAPQRWTPPATSRDQQNGIDAMLREALVERFFQTS